MLRFASAFAFTLLTAVLLTGCSGMYVNIPHQPGDIASENPNNERVRDLVAKACTAVIEDNNLPGPVAIKMPDTTSRRTDKIIASRVKGAISPAAQTKPQPATVLKVVGIRIRGSSGEVDMRAPTRGGSEMAVLHSVEANYSAFTHWTVQTVNVWPGVREGYE